MSDRCSAQITIGGPLTDAALDQLVVACESDNPRIGQDYCDDYCTTDGALLKEIGRAAEEGEPLCLYDEEATSGMFEEIEDTCRALGLTYVRSNDALAGAIEAEYAWWEPGMKHPAVAYATEAGGTVLVPLDDVEALLEAGCARCDGAIKAVITKYSPPDLPPITLVKEPPCTTT